MRTCRKFRIGHLFFKHVQGTPLERSTFNTSLSLGRELKRRGLINLYDDAGGDVSDIKNAVWFSYTQLLNNKELENLLFKGAA
jgi:hypothetical protein